MCILYSTKAEAFCKFFYGGKNMKKVLKGLFAAFFASTVLFTAWPQSVSMKNGTYTGTGEGKGGKITVQVTVKKNAIADIIVFGRIAGKNAAK